MWLMLLAFSIGFLIALLIIPLLHTTAINLLQEDGETYINRWNATCPQDQDGPTCCLCNNVRSVVSLQGQWFCVHCLVMAVDVLNAAVLHDASTVQFTTDTVDEGDSKKGKEKLN